MNMVNLKINNVDVVLVEASIGKVNAARTTQILIDNFEIDAIINVGSAGSANEELDIVKRGRNYKRGSHPKNTDIITYKMSSGFEALIGYLYLSNKKERLNEIMNIILGGSYEKDN